MVRRKKYDIGGKLFNGKLFQPLCTYPTKLAAKKAAKEKKEEGCKVRVVETSRGYTVYIEDIPLEW